MPLDGFGGTREHNDLAQFAQRVAAAARLESLSETEHRVRWQIDDRSGHTHTIALRSGITMMTARVRWDNAWSLRVQQNPSALKFMLLRGDSPRLSLPTGEHIGLSGSTLQVSQIHRSTELRFDFNAAPHTAQHEEVALELEPNRLCELLGSTELPAAVERVRRSLGCYPSEAFALTPALSLLFDEVTSCDARGKTRQLHLEAQGVELLASLLDAIDEATPPTRLSSRDLERLEAARRLLTTHLAEPPSLGTLARHAGMSPTKFKACFRARFGNSVYAYLRAERMLEAQRLLRARVYSVTEVAQRVGYANPSKFAAAFRRHFGVPPRCC